MWSNMPYHMSFIVWCNINFNMQYSKPILFLLIELVYIILHSSIQITAFLLFNIFLWHNHLFACYVKLSYDTHIQWCIELVCAKLHYSCVLRVVNYLTLLSIFICLVGIILLVIYIFVCYIWCDSTRRYVEFMELFRAWILLNLAFL